MSLAVNPAASAATLEPQKLHGRAAIHPDRPSGQSPHRAGGFMLVEEPHPRRLKRKNCPANSRGNLDASQRPVEIDKRMRPGILDAVRCDKREFGAEVHAMESVTVRLRKKIGRGCAYQHIEIPTDAEMERIAAELHQEHVPALVTVLGWKVLYVPGSPLKYSTVEVNPFTGEQGEKVDYETRTISYCVFGHGAQWRISYSWSQGDDGPPVRIQESGDIVPAASGSQGTLFE